MDKINKSRIPKKKAKNEPDAVLCDSCDFYYYSRWIQKRKDGNYCGSCSSLTVRAQIIRNKVNEEEVEKIARALLNAPPKKKSKSRKKK
jgi:hypothetical protein